MASHTVRQALDSKDPRERFAAVKHIARTKDVGMLRTLAQLAQDDPDNHVREIASRAVQYITGEVRLSGEEILNPVGSKPFVEAAPVSAKDEARAKGYLDSAIGYQINEEPDKALKELRKALKANPAIEADIVFRGVLDQITGTFGEESIAILHNEDRIEQFRAGKRQADERERINAHQEEVNRSSWASALMDLTIYTLILVFATLLLPVAVSQSASNYLARQQAAQETYAQEVAAGKQNVKVPDAIDPDFAALTTTAQTLNFSTGVILGLAVGIAGLLGLLINLFFTHLAARFLFGGQATFPHLIYKVVSFYNSRLPILYGLIYAGVIGTFLMGGGVVPYLFFGAAGLFSLLISFKVIGRVGEAYGFGFMNGCLSTLAASLILTVVGFIFQLLLLGSVTALLQSSLA